MNIHTIGGFGEVGKNMTAVHIGDDVIIFDMGLYLTPIVELEEREGVYDEKKLRRIGALPDDTILDKLNLREKVRAILLGHAHLFGKIRLPHPLLLPDLGDTLGQCHVCAFKLIVLFKFLIFKLLTEIAIKMFQFYFSAHIYFSFTHSSRLRSDLT